AAKAVPGLLAALAADNDRLLEHALIYALIQIDDRDSLLAGLQHSSPRVRRGALIALDQMDHGKLTSDSVLPLLGSGDLTLERTALDVISWHKDWAKESADLLSQWLNDANLSADRLTALRGVLVAFSADAHTQELMSAALAKASTPAATRLLLLEAMAQSELK